jgi:SAM-dependent methyltransferase
MENEIQKKNLICSCCGTLVSQRIFNKSGFDYYKCHKCGLVFIYPIPKNIDSVYSEDYFSGASKGFGYTDYDRDKEAMLDTFVSYLELLEKLYPQKGRLLDIGAASGYFMKLAQDRGWQVQGIDISNYAVELAKKKVLDVLCGTIEDVNLIDNSFDVVTMWDVLEHIPSPRISLEKIKRWLKPKGLLAINTPDTSSWCAKIMGKKWHLYISPEHIYYYNPANLSLLSLDLGYGLITKTKIGKRYTIPYIFNVLFHGKIPWIFKKFIGFLKIIKIDKLAVPINLRDNFIIIFKKK